MKTSAGSSISPRELRRLRKEIRSALEATTDQAYANRLKELVPGAHSVLGVRVPQIRALAKAFYDGHKDLDLYAICRLVNNIFGGRCREEVLFGIFLVARYHRHYSREMWSFVDWWVNFIDNWESCDQLAMNVAGEIVARDLSLANDLVNWAKSSNVWRRRFAVATTTVLNQKGRYHFAETFRVCEPLMEERDPVVQKAVAWALREVCKKSQDKVFDFLRRSRGRVHRRILREVGPKLSLGQRKQLGL